MSVVKKAGPQRVKRNGRVLQRVLDAVIHDDDVDRIDVVSDTLYLLEQAVKRVLWSKNPLLYFQPRSNDFTNIAAIVKGEDPGPDTHTIRAREAFQIYYHLEPPFTKNERDISTILDVRNIIQHELRDCSEAQIAAAYSSAISILISTQDLICSVCGRDGYEVVTFEDLKRQQSEAQAAFDRSFRKLLRKHQQIRNHLTQPEVRRRLAEVPTFDSTEIFVSSDGPILCPACLENGLDEISLVDFDYSDGEPTVYGISYYKCRVCGVELSKDFQDDVDESYFEASDQSR